MIRRWVKRHFQLYDLIDLTSDAICGLCLKGCTDVVPKDWPYSICDSHEIEV